MDDNVMRVDTTGSPTASRTALTDRLCANCGREKTEHVKVQVPNVDVPYVWICPSRIYEPERHGPR